MAVQLDHAWKGVPTLIVAGAYWMIGDIVLHLFDETAEIKWRCYLNPDARHQQQQPEEIEELARAGQNENLQRDITERWANLRRPIEDKTLFAIQPYYSIYFAPDAHSGEGLNVVEAAYRFSYEVEEPRGWKNFLQQGVSV